MSQAAQSVTIYGKLSCPFSERALEHYHNLGCAIAYVDLDREPDRLPELLAYTRGERLVPVIIRGDVVELGFEGYCGI
ncbi:MAG: glutaredoxin [Planctomycetota bacterium]